ncbi:hypothetical protein J3F81_002370 [Coemansia sp. RSA 371]|nr:hypothetical protein J3F81_002370 [Coemansia sp. RSA 371]
MKHPCSDLAGFLVNAPSLFEEGPIQDEEVDPDISCGSHKGAIRRFCFGNGDKLSCVRWDAQFHITSTDIIRALVHRFEDIKRPVVNIKKFEEGVFSDLRCLKPGTDARLELPRSEFLELLYKHHCVRTQKKQKVFYWTSVPHDMLFRDALERDLKREAMGIDPTTKITDQADPSSFVVIGGVELPLSVPPTLAAHMCMGAASGDTSSIHARVSTALVTTSAVARMGVASSIPKDKFVDSSQLTLATCPNAYNSDSSSTGAVSGDSVSFMPLHASSSNIQVHTARSCASQPTLSEYISGKSALAAESANPCGASNGLPTGSGNGSGYPSGVASVNDSWTGADFQTLHKKASELHADYNQYQPTPTPHHSPKEGADSDEGLLDLLSGDPNALVTQSNVNDFSTILEQLLGGSGRVQERVMNQDSPFEGQLSSLSGARPFFAPLQIETTRSSQSLMLDSMISADRSTSGMNMEVDISGITARSAVMMDTMNSMNSSPSVMSLANSQHMSTNQTPEISTAQRFGNSDAMRAAQPMPLNELDSILASVSASSGTPLNSAGANAATMDMSGSIGTGFVGQPLNSIFPMFDVSSDFLGFATASGAFSGVAAGVQPAASENMPDEARSVNDDTKPIDIVKQLWFNQKPTTAPTPRSTRFSRYHPYLKSMARMAHRGSPSLVNRVPSTADPNVAAAAVNAMVATAGRGAAASFVSSIGSNNDGISTSLAPPLPSLAMQDSSLVSLSCGDFAGLAAPNPSVLDFEPEDGACERAQERTKRKGKACDEDDQPRRYPCTFSGCTKQFKRHEHLKRHFRTHTGERPYKCSAPDCGKVFARMDNLNQHIRTHVNRKTATRRTSRIMADGAAQQQQGFADPGDGESAFGNMTYPEGAFSGGSDLVAMDENTNGNRVDMANYANAPGLLDTMSSSSINDRSAAAYVTAPMGMRTNAGEMRAAIPEELSLLSREWFMNNLGGQPQQVQSPQPPSMQSPLLENNVVSMLRKISKSNRARVASEFDIRSKDEQAFTPYGPSGEGADEAESGLMRTLSVESNESSINPIWLASFLGQEQRSGSGALPEEVAVGSRPRSLKRHHDDSCDESGDEASDRARRSMSTSSSERQGVVTGGVSANKFVRSGMARKSHITLV